MKYGVFALSLIISALSFAHGENPNAVYYKGAQEVGIAGDTAECYVEAVSLEQGSKALLRSLVADSHAETELVGVGPFTAAYSASHAGYYFRSSDAHAELQEALFVDVEAQTPGALSLVISHGHLAHAVVCANLSVLTGADRRHVGHLFAHFDEYVEGEHGHDHGDDHDHHGHAH